ncbi:ABC transporter permease subunit [Microbacterium telephonicum]|uniref:ABC-2 type transport system permease protein n=1 Tax=Microbacterium telephonicum TaxID=1714841 RepID=A0A498C401_9MICO|nr:ABC transporter permease subunit [Microbacterium telephonicum]RLK49276.1 ABC-2 type transport system permease protein [Microbacterium telephonicum]
MTAVAAPTRATVRTASPYRLSFGRVLRAEFLKLLTLRSTWWSLIITLALTVGMALLIAGASGGDVAPIAAAVLPIQFTMLLAGILGAIAVSGEYSTGMIRSTLTAEPLRGAVLLSKAIAVAVTVFVATLVTFAAAALLVAAVSGASIPWETPEASVLPLLYAPLAMAAFALLGVGFGFALRNGPAAIAATVGVLFVLPIVASIFGSVATGWQWVLEATQYLPMNAAQSFIMGGGALDQGVAGLTLAAWVVGLLAAGWLVLRSRDA